MKCKHCQYTPNGSANRVACWQQSNAQPGIPPFASKKAGRSFLELGEDGLRLSVKNPVLRPRELRILYSEVFDVSFVPAARWRKGFLCVRDRRERHVPLPRSYWDWHVGDSLLFFHRRDNGDFCRAYRFLKQCAEINASRREEAGKEPPLVRFPQPPFALQKLRHGFLEFEKDEVRISARLPKRVPQDVCISYAEVYDTAFVPAARGLVGFLCVRNIRDKHVPLPQSATAMERTHPVIWFDAKQNAQMHAADEFLKQCAAINAETRK